jgi:hypothetical protein
MTKIKEYSWMLLFNKARCGGEDFTGSDAVYPCISFHA